MGKRVVRKKKRALYTQALVYLKKATYIVLVFVILVIMGRWVWTNYTQSQTASSYSQESQRELNVLLKKRDRLIERNTLSQTPTGILDRQIIELNGRLPGEQVIVLIQDKQSTEENDTSNISEKVDTSFWSWLPFL